MNKSYRLSIEDAYLADSSEGPLPLPAAEFDYLLLVPRMVLKHCPWDALLARQGRPNRSERRGLEGPENRRDPQPLVTRREQFLLSSTKVFG